MQVEDSNKPAITYLFKESVVVFLEKRHDKQVRDSAKNVDESSWPISAEQFADAGIFCGLSAEDTEHVGRVPWQKGFYINGDEDDLMSTLQLLDEYVTSKFELSEWQSVKKEDRAISIINHAALNLDGFAENSQLKHYEVITESVPADFHFHILAAKPPGQSRVLIMHITQTNEDGNDHVTLCVTGNTYPFKCESMSGQYYDPLGQPCNKEDDGAKWWDTIPHVEMGTCCVELIDTIFHYSAMCVKLCAQKMKRSMS